jgi:cobalt/nickel transport system permease protein
LCTFYGIVINEDGPMKGLTTDSPLWVVLILGRVDIMHMSDALISPVVGGAMLAVTAGIAGHSVRKLRMELEEEKVPLMGVMGAFVFAAQMINFAIPGTGSSGHIGGGMLLAALLGPYAGFLAMASVLLIQALFFGDGGLLAYGCNVFNLGFFTCFVAYPHIFRRLVQKGITTGRLMKASLLAAIAALQLGAFSVVLETYFSGKTELPFSTFVLLMQPIHLAIGVIEGLITAAVVVFIWKARPELLEGEKGKSLVEPMQLKRLMGVLLVLVILIGGVFSWFASSSPDGLEWSMERTAGTAELEAEGTIYNVLAKLQNKTALLPDYSFGTGEEKEASWPSVDAGTSVSGIVGGGLTLGLVLITCWIIRINKRRGSKAAV